MPNLLTTKTKNEKGYHIRDFDPEARRLSRAGATIAGVNTGNWIAQAVKEKFARDISKGGERNEG